jgi:squalene-associated FAD-dependent desaturase
VGGGWAGLSAAVWCQSIGLSATLFEAAAHCGGRAKSVRLALAGRSLTVDNGQHLLMGAYRDTVALVDLVTENSPSNGLERVPFSLASTEGWQLGRAPLPAPLHLAWGLLTAKGIAWRDRWQLVGCLRGLQSRHWQVDPGMTVREWTQSVRASAWLTQRLWDPLCVATLNTDPVEACAQTFAHVLRDSLGANDEAIEPLFVSKTLHEVLPEPALAWLQGHGASVQTSTIVRALEPESGGWKLTTAAGTHHFDQVILALPPRQVSRLLEPWAPACSWLGQFSMRPIASVYLAWEIDRAPALPQWIMLQERIEREHYGQWLFRRDCQQGLQLGCVVISAAGRASSLDRATLTQRIIEQLGEQMGWAAGTGSVMPIDAAVVTDREATFACTPLRPKPQVDGLQTALAQIGCPSADRLWIAGDFVWPEYPATLEAAVRSGKLAAIQAHHRSQRA